MPILAGPVGALPGITLAERGLFKGRGGGYYIRPTLITTFDGHLDMISFLHGLVQGNGRQIVVFNYS